MKKPCRKRACKARKAEQAQMILQLMRVNLQRLEDENARLRAAARLAWR